MSNDKFITLEQLTRTTKGLVNKVNAESTVFDSKIGDLANLTTTAKTDLVSAINEAATSGGSGGSGSGTSAEELFLITATGSNDAITIDKTFAEITTAHNAGKICYIKYYDRPFFITNFSSSSIDFSLIYPVINNSQLQYENLNSIKLNSDDTINFYIKANFITNSLPMTAGTAGQILKAPSSGTTLVWADMPTIPVVTDTYSSASTDAMSGVAVNSAITSAIGNINEFEVAVVQTLPSENIDTHTIYFVPKTGSVTDVHDEYMYINNNWELLGSTSIDLSNYLQKTDIADWAKTATKPSYTANEVGAAASDHTHTEISASSTSGREITKAYAKVYSTGIVTLSASESGGSVSTEGTSSITVYPQSISISATSSVSISNVKTPTKAGDAANKKYVDDAVSGITIPTNVSDLTNDAGYLTSYTETDPVFAASAAAGISSTDISNWNAKSNFSGSYNDLTNKPTIPAAQVQSDWNATSGMGVILNKPTIPTVPTNVSSFTNDAGYLTLADLPIYDGTVQNG